MRSECCSPRLAENRKGCERQPLGHHRREPARSTAVGLGAKLGQAGQHDPAAVRSERLALGGARAFSSASMACGPATAVLDQALCWMS